MAHIITFLSEHLKYSIQVLRWTKDQELDNRTVRSKTGHVTTLKTGVCQLTWPNKQVVFSSKHVELSSGFVLVYYALVLLVFCRTFVLVFVLRSLKQYCVMGENQLASQFYCLVVKGAVCKMFWGAGSNRRNGIVLSIQKVAVYAAIGSKWRSGSVLCILM